MSDFREHLRRAITLMGSQQALAEAAGCTQQHISWLLSDGVKVGAEIANEIHKATGGAVSRSELRPDLYADEKVSS